MLTEQVKMKKKDDKIKKSRSKRRAPVISLVEKPKLPNLTLP